MDMKSTANTSLTTRDRYKNSMMAHDKFPPCGDMPYLITRLREQGFIVKGRILDAGCGQGRFSRYMAQLAGTTEIIGVDESKDAITVANLRKPSRAAEKIDFQRDDITACLKRNGGRKRFEIIGAFNILEYVKDPKEVMKLFVFNTKTNGFIVGSVYVGDVLPYSINHWKDAKAFIKDFPDLTIIDMKSPDLGCVVFMYKKLSKRKKKSNEAA